MTGRSGIRQPGDDGPRRRIDAAPFIAKVKRERTAKASC
jgi:hypothetical protein